MIKTCKLNRTLLVAIPLTFVLIGCGGSGGSTSITATLQK